MTEHDQIQHTHIGGQAVLEGVMMRGKLNWAVAVRKPDGSIHVEEHDLPHRAADRAWLRWPIIRGCWAMYETLSLALKAFAVSAAQASDDGDEAGGLSGREIAVTMGLGGLLAVVIFIILPAVGTNLLGKYVQSSTVLWNVINGVMRLVIFFLYIWAVSRMKDIQRVFSYHGAEHKTIHAYEHGDPLDPEHIRGYTTLHVRCGTSFLLMVMVVAVLVYMLVPVRALVPRMVSHLLLLPVVAGLAYEVSVKWAGNNPDMWLVRILLWPGLQLQRLTTNEPDDSMIEVAAAAMAPVIARERAAEAGEPAAREPADGSDPEGEAASSERVAEDLAIT